MKIVYENVIWLLMFIAYNYLCLAEIYQDKKDKTSERNDRKRRSTFDNITIGAFFHGENSQSKIAFDCAIYTANMMPAYSVHKYVGKDVIISETDSFEVSKSICEMAKEGVGGVFGPFSVKASYVVESTCLNLEIPHIQTSWRPSSFSNQYTRHPTVINLFPKSEILVKGIGVIAKHLQWRSYVVFYEDSDSLVRVQDLVKMQNFDSNNLQNTIILKHLGPGPDYRPVLKQILNSTELRFVVDCKTENIIEILKQAKEIKLMERRHSYFLTSLDAHTVDLSVLDSKANITTIRIVDPTSANFEGAQRDWQQYVKNKDLDRDDLEPFSIKTETALMHDAVYLFVKAVHDLDIREPIETENLNCEEENNKWKDGFPIVSFIKMRNFIPAGITGPVKFDTFGNRDNFTIYMVEGNKESVIATWSPDDGEFLQFVRDESERNLALQRKLQEDELIVSSRIGSPYLMERKSPDGERYTGNARYEGFSMDLIQALADELNFTFRFELAADKKYGNYDPETKSWNGLIKDILDRKADLAICDLTITHERRDVVDFSTPFMRLGISILYKKEEEKNASLFAFLEPFSTDVWIYSATLYLALTVIMYFVIRMSPADWESPHPCDQNPEELENVWDLKNCLWLTVGSVMNQGCDIFPKGISSRMVTAMWWFFAIIITNSYMANLAAFLTMERREPSINNAEDLAKQSKIKYGTLKGGSTEAFFKNSNYSVYQRMWTAMKQAKPTVFENSNEEGVNRVKNTRNNLYAYLMESTTLEYQLVTQCDLKQVGNLLDSKGYGIAMPIDYPYRSKINKAILNLQDNGKIKDLKERWWKLKRDKPPCPADTGDDENAAKLALNKVGGVFLVLGVGVALAFIVAMMEFLWNVRNVSVEEHISYWEALKVEVEFALKVWITQKRTKPEISESSSSHGESDSKSIAHSILHNAGSFLRLDVLSKSRSPTRDKD